jgi:hypothetical protein
MNARMKTEYRDGMDPDGSTGTAKGCGFNGLDHTPERDKTVEDNLGEPRILITNVHPRNRPWRPIGVFPVRYQYHLHVQSKAILVKGRRGSQVCFL